MQSCRCRRDASPRRCSQFEQNALIECKFEISSHDGGDGFDDALSVLLQKNVVSPSNVDKISSIIWRPFGRDSATVSIAEGTASSGLLVFVLDWQVAAENGKSSTQFQAAVLSARMLLSGLKCLPRAEEKSNDGAKRRQPSYAKGHKMWWRPCRKVCRGKGDAQRTCR